MNPTSPIKILLDLKLLKVDGLEVPMRRKGDPRTRSIPAEVLTSSKEQNDIVRIYNLSVNSYIVKPVVFEGFAAAVQQRCMDWLLLNPPPKAPSDRSSGIPARRFFKRSLTNSPSKTGWRLRHRRRSASSRPE